MLLLLLLLLQPPHLCPGQQVCLPQRLRHPALGGERGYSSRHHITLPPTPHPTHTRTRTHTALHPRLLPVAAAPSHQLHRSAQPDSMPHRDIQRPAAEAPTSARPPQLRAARSDPSPSPSPAPQVHTAAPSTLPSAPASGTQLPSPAAAAASAAARTACSPAMPGSAYSRLLATPTAVATCLAQCIDGGNETPHVLPPPPRMHACMAHQWARRSAPPGGWRCRSGAGGASRSRPPAAAAGHV